MDWNTLIAVVVGGFISAATAWLTTHQRHKLEHKQWKRAKLYEIYSNLFYYLSLAEEPDAVEIEEGELDSVKLVEIKLEHRRRLQEVNAQVSKWGPLLDVFVRATHRRSREFREFEKSARELISGETEAGRVLATLVNVARKDPDLQGRKILLQLPVYRSSTRQ